MTEYSIEYRRQAQRDLERLPARLRAQIGDAVAGLAVEPRPNGSVKMKGQINRYRIRVGDYRVVYRIDDDARAIVVTTLGHRSVVYPGMSLAFLLLRLRSL